MNSTKFFSGEFEINDPDGIESSRGQTVQCVHCMRSWIYNSKDIKKRGFCWKCYGFICGPSCLECKGPIRSRILNGEI